MRFFIAILVLFIATICGAKKSSEEVLVRVGDSSTAVRNNLGEPRIEFPLHGQLIQDYGSFVVISSNGVVVAVKERRKAPSKTEETQENGSAAQTLESLLAKANAGDAESQYCLGYCYQAGKAVTMNMDEAIRWYTLAAMQGHAASQHNLGVIYMTGAGVDKDCEQAYTWAFLAAENGNDTLIQALRLMLTPEQEKAGRMRAARILNGHEQPPYGTPDSSAAFAKKESSASGHASN